MNCKRIERLLSDERDGELSAPDTDALIVHLRGCRACRRYRKALHELGAEARELPRPATPFQGKRLIAERWLAERHTGTGVRQPWLMARWSALAAAAVLLASVALRSSLAPSAPDRSPLRLAGRPWPEARHGGSQPAPQRGLEAPEAAHAPRTPRLAHASVRFHALGRARPIPYRTSGGSPLRETGPRIHQAPSDWDAIEERLRRSARAGDDFVQIPLPRLAASSGELIAAAVAGYQREVAVVDARLSRKISLAVKATPLLDLLDRLRADTGIHLKAGRSTADEKVTLFCRELPLRDVMRQLSRPFGYTWLRSQLPAPSSQLPAKSGPASAGTQEPGAGSRGEAAYRYELVQDLRSQLLEEELRDRDRREALLALERSISGFRQYLDLSPEEARARARTAPPAEKKLLEHLGGSGWGMAQIYFRLTPQQQAALRDGQELLFSVASEPGQQPLPEEVARGVLSSLSHRRIAIIDGGVMWGYPADLPQGQPPASVPEARPQVILQMRQSELGQYSLEGGSGFSADLPSGSVILRDVDTRNRLQGPLAVGVSPSVLRPDNAAAHSRLAHDPALQRRLSVMPEASCRADAEKHDPKVTSADLLEAIHRATGLPVVGDYYTRLTPKADVSVQDARLFDALNRLADAARLVWRKDGSWLQFRSAAYFQDRLKEVPHRLLARWSAARPGTHGTPSGGEAAEGCRGALSLDEVLEIATLPDAQLDGESMAEGARDCYGLVEWGLARSRMLRPHWRFLAGLSPELRQEAAGAAGLTFAKLAPGQQQQFIALALGPNGSLVERLSDLAAATVRVEYTPPGGFTWRRSSVARELTRPTPRASVIREPTPEAALLAARRVDPAAGPAQIVPTAMDAVVVYTVGARDGRRAERIVGPSTQQFSTD